MSKNPRLSKPFLPREGLTLEAMFYPVQSLFLQPFLTGPLAYLLLARPEVVRRAVPWGGRLERFVSKKSTAVGFCILFGVGILSRLSSWLSRWSVNNFVRDKTWDWTKEVVVVTGGSSGIGLEMVSRFAQLRIKTIILDIVPPSAGVLDTAGVCFYNVDLSSPSAIAAAAAKVKQEHGHPSVLINNAGIGVAKNVLDENEAERRRLFDVNVLAHFTLAREFVPAMIENNHGHLVTIASMASFYTQAQNVSYACSKAAAMAFHEGIGQELRIRYNAPRVRTTIVHPTWIRTPLIQSITENRKCPEFLLEPGTVADAVVDQVLSGTGGSLILPARLIPVTLLRGLPLWVLRLLQAGDGDIIALTNK